jgi:hypothetical protein
MRHGFEDLDLERLQRRRSEKWRAFAAARHGWTVDPGMVYLVARRLWLGAQVDQQVVQAAQGRAR